MGKLRKLPNSWWYKIPDPARCPRCGAIGLTSKKPFDIVGVLDGEPIAIEVKMKDFKTTDHQLANLILFAEAGGRSCIYNVGASVMRQYIVSLKSWADAVNILSQLKI